MKYLNAADVLPEELLQEIEKYAAGKLLYVPLQKERCRWGEKNGSRQFFTERNGEITRQFQAGESLDVLADRFGLSCDTIRKIVKIKK